MAALFKRFTPGLAGSTSPGGAGPSKKKTDKDAELEADATPLVRMLQNAGPIRQDGSDKFFGMENFGNTCYCNSIIQALYYSTPFRENVVRYPPRSPVDTPSGEHPKLQLPTIRPPLNGVVVPPGVKSKAPSSSAVLKQRAAINSGQASMPGAVIKPEDNPNSPEYKKKHAMAHGPILELNYDNALSYGMEESTFTALKDIFAALIANPSRTGVLSPQRFLELFKRENESFRTQAHQDAHEFYGLVLNGVISSVEAHAPRLKELDLARDEGNLKSIKAAAASALGLPSGMTSPGTGWVHDIFEGVLTSETKCLTCETTSQRDETFLDLSIDLDAHSSVTSCLRKFSAEEMLCERNKFHCDSCGGLQEAEKRMKIKKLPKILALHLKRFKYTDDMQRLQKLFHRVVYPYHLRMFNTTDDAEDPDRLYELYAVVIHIGSNAYHGHYVAVIKTHDRGWLLFDDEMVEPVDKSYVRQFFGDKPGQACAYVLFYQETTVEAMRKEQEAEGASEAAMACQEADAVEHPHMNGTHPSATSKAISNSTSKVPVPEEETNGFASIGRAMSTPLTPSSPTTPRPIPIHQKTLPVTPRVSTSLPTHALSPDTSRPKTKAEKERQKKDAKEAEKALKAASKEQKKADEKRKKEEDSTRREKIRTQMDENRRAAEENRKVIALSKQTAEEEEKRREASPTPAPTRKRSASENGNGHHAHPGPPSAVKEKDKSSFGLGNLGRHQRGSKSMSRKSLNFLSGKSPEKNMPGDSIPEIPEERGLMAEDRESRSDKGEPVALPAQSPEKAERAEKAEKAEKSEKVKKERFSLSNLRRKSSTIHF